MNIESTLFTIGHGARKIADFVNLLNTYAIDYVVDVRSNPYSRWAPDYNLDRIGGLLRQNNIVYGYMGAQIGGRPDSLGCYDPMGYIDYRLMAQQQNFIDGINRLVDANNRHLRVALMCSELDPAQCHRSKLIGRELMVKHDIMLHHILSVSQIISESDVITSLTHGEWQLGGSLFGSVEPPYFKSRKANPSAKIAI